MAIIARRWRGPSGNWQDRPIATSGPTMRLPLVYHDDYSPEFPPEHRFPMDKFRLLHDHLIACGLTTDLSLIHI